MNEWGNHESTCEVHTTGGECSCEEPIEIECPTCGALCQRTSNGYEAIVTDEQFNGT